MINKQPKIYNFQNLRWNNFIYKLGSFTDQTQSRKQKDTTKKQNVQTTKEQF